MRSSPHTHIGSNVLAAAPAGTPDGGPECSLALRLRGPSQASGSARRGGPATRLALRGALGLLTLLVAGGTRAAEPEPVRVDYRADDSCPNADAFARAVLLRTNRARSAREHESARTFHVAITHESERVRGALTITGARDTDQTGTRAVESASCGEVFDALVLFAALSVDADASQREAALDASPPVVTAPRPSTTEQQAEPWVPLTRDSRGDATVRRFRWVTGFDGGALSAGPSLSAYFYAFPANHDGMLYGMRCARAVP